MSIKASSNPSSLRLGVSVTFGLNATDVQCVTRCDSLHKGDRVYIHRAQDGNVKDLV